MEMIEMLKPIAFDVIICMTQLFDYYLYTIYTLFACDMVRFFFKYLINRMISNFNFRMKFQLML
jgi:hypothetical protein